MIIFINFFRLPPTTFSVLSCGRTAPQVLSLSFILYIFTTFGVIEHRESPVLALPALFTVPPPRLDFLRPNSAIPAYPA